jgi:hypothetical protein
MGGEQIGRGVEHLRFIELSITSHGGSIAFFRSTGQ